MKIYNLSTLDADARYRLHLPTVEVDCYLHIYLLLIACFRIVNYRLELSDTTWYVPLLLVRATLVAIGNKRRGTGEVRSQSYILGKQLEVLEQWT